MAARKTGCQKCSSKTWMCLSCGMEIPTGTFNRRKSTTIAVYCNCCEHAFVCRKCYSLTPDFDIWEDQFGPEHCIIDLVEEPMSLNSSFLSFLLQEFQEDMMDLDSE